MLAKTLGVALVAAVLSSAATYALLDKRITPIETRMAHTPPIMVWDRKNFIELFIGNTWTDEESDKLKEHFGQELKKLREAGYLVLSKDAVPFWLPPGLDFHKEVIEPIVSEFSPSLEEETNFSRQLEE